MAPAALLAAACSSQDPSPAGIDLLPGDVLGELRTLVTSDFERAVDFVIFPSDRARADRLTVAHDWPEADDFESRALFRFSLASLDSLAEGTTFEEPRLRLVFARPKARVELRVHRVTRAWTEEAATWTRSDFGQPWAAPGGDFDPAPVALFAIEPAPDDTAAADTTAVADSVFVPLPDSLFAGWRSGAIPNHGLIVVQDTPGEVVDFVSRGAVGENPRGPVLGVTTLLPDTTLAADLRLLAIEDVFIALDESPFSSGGLVVRGAEPPMRAVLEGRFEEVPPGTTIASARLVLTIRDLDVPRDSLTIFAVPLVTEFRGENTVFGSTVLSLGFVTLPATAQPGDTLTFESGSLTLFVRRWVADPESNRGFGLRLPEGGGTAESVAFGGVQFHGLEAAPELRPRFRIVFAPSPLSEEED